MRIHRLVLYFLLFFVTFNKAFGFVPILELGDDTSAASAASFSSKPLYSRPLSDLEQQEVEEIYDTIFMQYGCPMLLHTYPLLSEAEQRGVIAALSQEFGAQELIRERVNSRYPGKYRVRFVPEIIFQMGAILQIGELAIRGNNGDFRAEQYFAELINTDCRREVTINLH